MSDNKRSLLRSVPAMFALFVLATVAVVYLATPAVATENLRPPAAAAAGCLCFVLLAVVYAFRGVLTVGPFIFAESAAIAAAAICWYHVPTESGISNAEASRITNRAAEVLGRTNTFSPPGLQQAWTDVDRIGAAFPAHAEQLRAARARWESRFETHLAQLNAGSLDAEEFTQRRAERQMVASAIPKYQERIPAAERAWCESQLARLTKRLEGLKWTEEQRERFDTPVVAILVDRAPDLFAKLVAAEAAWQDSAEATLAASIRDTDPTLPGAVLERREAGARYIAKFSGRGSAIRAAEAEWVKRCVQRGLADAAKQEPTDPAGAAEELVATYDRLKRAKFDEPFPEELTAALTRTVAKAIDAGRKQTREAIREDRFQAAATAAEALAARLSRAADLAGLTSDLKGFYQSCRFLAELANKAGQPDPEKP